jgi:hypothetical protein
LAALTNAELVAALTGRRRPAAPSVEPGVRFAFYGRMSTSTFQDVQTSRAWQRAVSDELIDGVGSVVVEFFDVGVSRRWSWLDRPEAAALLAAADPDRDFDAVVVGEATWPARSGFCRQCSRYRSASTRTTTALLWVCSRFSTRSWRTPAAGFPLDLRGAGDIAANQRALLVVIKTTCNPPIRPRRYDVTA